MMGPRGGVQVHAVGVYSGDAIDEEVDPLRGRSLLRILEDLCRAPGAATTPRVEEPIE
jgi:hypothetical protein